MDLNKLTLKNQFMLVILLLCLVFLLIGFVGLRDTATIQEQTKILARNTTAPMRSLAEVASRIPRMRVGFDMILLQEVQTLKDKKGVLTHIKEARTEDIPEMTTALEDALAAQATEENRQKVKSILTKFEAVQKDELTPMLAALERNDLPTAHRIYQEQYAASYGVMRKAVNEVLDGLLAQSNATYAQSNEQYQQNRNAMITLMIVSLVISLARIFHHRSRAVGN